MLQYFKKLLPSLKIIEDVTFKPDNQKKLLKKPLNLEKPIKKNNFCPLPIKKLRRMPLNNEENELLKPNSARNKSKNNENIEHSTLKKRRRSLSFGFQMKETIRNTKEYPISAKNYRENSQKPIYNEESLSDINENEESVYEDHLFNNEVISIQNKLLKEKNKEISFLKDKLKSFQDISKE